MEKSYGSKEIALMEIYRITKELSVQWQLCGKDIFETYAGGEPAFEMKSDRICLYDFEDNYYEISYDGEVIHKTSILTKREYEKHHIVFHSFFLYNENKFVADKAYI